LKKWYEYPLKFSSFRTGSKLKMLLKWHLFKWKAFYIKDTYWFFTMVIIHRQEDIILAPITKFNVQTWTRFLKNNMKIHRNLQVSETFLCDYKILLKWVVSKCVKYVKIRWFCLEKVRIEALKGKIEWFYTVLSHWFKRTLPSTGPRSDHLVTLLHLLRKCRKILQNIKSGFCLEKVRIEALKGKIFNFNEITKITECTRVPVVYMTNRTSRHRHRAYY
jgi:hypothetical protein